MIRIYDPMRSLTVPAAIAIGLRCDRDQHDRLPQLFLTDKSELF